MDLEQFKNLPVFNESEQVLDVTDMEDQSDRTLFYGYFNDGDSNVTHHVYLQGCFINILQYGYLQNVVSHRKTRAARAEELVFARRLYPEACDEEASILLMNLGVSIPFTSFTENRGPHTFYGLTLEELEQPKPHVVVLWTLKERLIKYVREVVEKDTYHEDVSQADKDFMALAYKALLSVYQRATGTESEKEIEEIQSVFTELSKDLNSLHYNNQQRLETITADLNAFRDAAAVVGISLDLHTPKD
jgi:hypothetical protein